MSDTLDLACDLIRRPSVTPIDAGCQALIAERLQRAGFKCESLCFGEVDNLWARHGTDSPLLVFAGHTDVVPPGIRADWDTNPFEPVIRDGRLYGRGAADMKGSLAAMVVAAERFVAEFPEHRGSLAFLITSDEEGLAIDGTRRVVPELTKRGVKIDWCVVGEPSSSETVGDAIRRGRRGSLTGRLAVIGRQGHVAYPDKADNPVHRMLPALDEAVRTEWDEGHPDFPPTSFQIANVYAGAGADNVIPGRAEAQFNFRYAPSTDMESLQEKFTAILERHGLKYELDWHDSGRPFHTPDGDLLDAVIESVKSVTGREPELSTAGGTSDGRFIAPTGAHVVELGPVNATIHQVNENVAVEELAQLTEVHADLLQRLLL